MSSCDWCPEDDFNDSRLTLKQFIRRYVMAIDLSSKSLDFSCSTIDDLILADIRLQAIVDKIGNYNYPMSWLTEKHDEIKAELEARMRKYRREELRKLKKEREELATPEERKRDIDAKIAELEALK